MPLAPSHDHGHRCADKHCRAASPHRATARAPIPHDIFVTVELGHRTTTHATVDDPWDFGGNWQYPVLKYGALKDVQQRAEGDARCCPREPFRTTEGGKTTVTATQEGTSNLPTTVVMLTVAVGSDAVTLSENTTLTIDPANKTEERPVR